MKKTLIGFSLLVGGVLAAGLAIAQVTVPQSFILTFINGAEQVQNAVVTLDLPAPLSPLGLANGTTWDPASRKLTINIGKLQPNQEIQMSVAIDGPAGNYLINGTVDGLWPRLNERFSSPLAPLAITIPSLPQPPITAEVQQSFIDRLRSPQVIGVVESVVVPVSITVAVAGATGVVGSALSANAAFAYNISEFLRFIGFGFFRLRRKKPWGKVYNELTGKPIARASVKIYDAQFHKLHGSEITDAEGRFGFLVKPGVYYLIASARGFKNYQSANIKVAESESLNLEIPLESEDRFMSEPTIELIAAWIKNLLQKISPLLLIIGILTSLFAAIVVPSVVNFSILGLYLVMTGVKIILAGITVKSFGTVTDKITRTALPLAVVRIFDANRNWLLATKATDDAGRFKFLVTAGDYYLTCAKPSYRAYQSTPAKISKAAAITWDITLEPER